MPQPGTIKIWDPLVRLFHWSLVLAFAIAYFTEEDLLDLHVWAGYTVLGLILFRIFWGFVGPRYAQFKNFVYSRNTIKAYIKDIFAFRAKRYLGHNPAGGAMIILLIIFLLITTFSGLVTYGIEKHAGPLAPWLSHLGDFWEDVAEDIHEFFANFTLVLVFVHVSGVIFESRLHHENLVKSMFNGYKKRNDTIDSGNH
ncbi:Cytochrome b [hydrothermal vent metagenome]|uniref:Cytochrome b n=1 Tax=hydrothermal vent metagenome TaxID=652676 RepID=A0A3B1BAS5_9ZZZZ